MDKLDLQKIDYDVPGELVPQEEVVQMAHEIVMGDAIRERAMFRFWRMWSKSTYLDIGISGDNPVPRYSSFGDLVNEFRNVIDISRTKIYTRVKTYELLARVGYGSNEMIAMMSTRPNLYERAMSAIFLWDWDKGGIVGLRTDRFGSYDDEEGNPANPETMQNIRDFVDELALHDSIKDALEYLSRDIIGKPDVKIFLKDGELLIRYSEEEYDDDGNRLTSDYNEIVFVPDGEIPLWVAEEVSKRYRVMLI